MHVLVVDLLINQRWYIWFCSWRNIFSTWNGGNHAGTVIVIAHGITSGKDDHTAAMEKNTQAVNKNSMYLGQAGTYGKIDRANGVGSGQTGQ